jgi:hypothetical protein
MRNNPLFLSEVAEYYYKNKKLPVAIDINMLTEDEIIDLLKVDPKLFQDIKVSKLTEGICRQAVLGNISNLQDLPEKFSNPDIYSEVIYHKGINSNTKKYLPKNCNWNHLIVMTVNKHHSLGSISIKDVNERVIVALIKSNSDAKFLECFSSLDAFMSESILNVLIFKYQKSFLKYIKAPISQSLFKQLLVSIKDLKLQDFNTEDLNENMLLTMITLDNENILALAAKQITPVIAAYIYNLNQPVYNELLKHLPGKQINVDTVQAMKKDASFLITDLPSNYVSREEYIKRLNVSDNIKYIDKDVYNQELADLVFNLNVNNFKYIPEVWQSQTMIKAYSLIYPQKELIDKIVWNQEYAYEFAAKVHNNFYYRYIPTCFRDEKYYEIVNGYGNRYISSLDNVSAKSEAKAKYIYERKIVLQEKQEKQHTERYHQFLEAIKEQLVDGTYHRDAVKFRLLVRHLVNYNPELMNMIASFSLRRYLQDNEDFKNTCVALLNNVRDGVITSKGTRPFNAYDFMFFTDQDIAEILTWLKNNNLVDASDLIKINSFAKYFVKSTSMDEHYIMTVNYYDKEGKLIISDDVRKQIIDFMNSNNIPTNQNAYVLIKDAYLNHLLDITKVYPKTVPNGIHAYEEQMKNELLTKIESELNQEESQARKLTKKQS